MSPMYCLTNLWLPNIASNLISQVISSIWQHLYRDITDIYNLRYPHGTRQPRHYRSLRDPDRLGLCRLSSRTGTTLGEAPIALQMPH